MIDHHSRRRYEVRHRTAYTYSDDVTASFERAMLRPRETEHQKVLDHAIEISPEPDRLDESVDAFGNWTHYVEISTPHTELVVAKRTIVEIAWPLADLAALNAWTVESAAAFLRTAPDVDPFEHAAYTLPSTMVTLEDEVRAFAHVLLPGNRPLGEAIEAVYREIYSGFTYSQGVTSVSTTLPEVLAARAGVCQDFAHLGVACLRAVGLPARYVSGYIETTPAPGTVKLEGSDASHAWVGVLTPGGWVDLDPTNNHLADSRYIVTAWGRDYRDVSPLKGIIFTEGSGSTLTVAVDVKRLD